jgi:hypothetical protein
MLFCVTLSVILRGGDTGVAGGLCVIGWQCQCHGSKLVVWSLSGMCACVDREDASNRTRSQWLVCSKYGQG